MVKVKKVKDINFKDKNAKKDDWVVVPIKPTKERKKSISTLTTPLKKKKPKVIVPTATPSKDSKALKKLVVFESLKQDEVPRKQKNDKKVTSDKNQENILHKKTIEEFEEKLNITIGNVENAVNGVLKARKTNPKLEKQLFEDRAPLFLHITCHKVPKGYKKIFRIPLKNSVLTAEDEVCLIVPEVKGIGNKDHEKHVEHYENLMEAKGVSSIKKIMTCHELRTEYETFEQKSRLVDLYDIFLVDGKVSGKVVNKCGKIFYKKRKVPISVKLQSTKLKEHIENTLSKVPLFLHLKGNGFTVQFGHTDMEVHKLVENVYSILEFLKVHFPGKFDNIKGIQAFGPRATSIPIYMSFENQSELKTPVLKPKKPKAYKAFSGELTTLPNVNVTVMPTGRVLVRTIKEVDDNQEVDDNRITDEDIIKSNKEDLKKLKTKKIDEESKNNNKKVKKGKRKADDSDVKTDKVKKNKRQEGDVEEKVEKVNKKAVEEDDVEEKVEKKTKKKAVEKGMSHNQLEVTKKKKKSKQADVRENTKKHKNVLAIKKKAKKLVR